jgi:hypothetical protein
MLKHLENNLSPRGLTNVHLINADFITVNLAELGHFDIVLASRSLPMGNLRQALFRMNSLATRFCYLTWLAGRSEDDAKLCELLGVEYHPYPDYLIIANMLYTMGISANIEIFTLTGEHRYASIDDAVTYALHGRQVDEEGRRRLKDYYTPQLYFSDGSWCRRISNCWALIWWQKH